MKMEPLKLPHQNIQPVKNYWFHPPQNNSTSKASNQSHRWSSKWSIARIKCSPSLISLLSGNLAQAILEEYISYNSRMNLNVETPQNMHSKRSINKCLKIRNWNKAPSLKCRSWWKSEIPFLLNLNSLSQIRLLSISSWSMHKEAQCRPYFLLRRCRTIRKICEYRNSRNWDKRVLGLLLQV